MIENYEDKKSNTFFIQLINLKQKGSIVEYIEDFQKLNIRVKDIPEEHMIDAFIGTLKDNIQHEVCLWESDSLDKSFRLAIKNESKIMVTRKPTTHNYKYGSLATPRVPLPTRLEEKRSKWLFYSCDRKYTKGHKCAEKKFFTLIVKRRNKMNKKLQKKRIYTRNQP